MVWENNKLQRANEQKKAEDRASEKRFLENSKKKLLQAIEKKLQTSFIGALSRFESRFGEIWGHGKDELDCRDNQLKWRDIYEECRHEILNNGNNQIRAMHAELNQYLVKWIRNQLNLPVQNRP